MNTIYLDFDNTIVESNKRVIDIINKRYGTNKTEADLLDYGYQSIYPISDEEKLGIYESDEFFEDLEIKPHVLDVLIHYMQKYEIIITTKGTSENLRKKKTWIDENLPFGLGFIGITNDSLSKRSVDMSNGIQVDDVSKALDTNAGLHILYRDGNYFPWQKIEANDDIIVANTWWQIEEILEFCLSCDYKSLKVKKECF